MLSATLESEHGCFALAGDPSPSTPDIIEIDPSLTNNNNNNSSSGVPQNPIPAFSGLSEAVRWPKDGGAASILDRMRQNPGGSKFFGSTLMQDMINGESMTDLSMSPDVGATTSSSDRPTPNSSTSASDRQQQQSSNGDRGASGRNSFDTSSASSNAQQQQQRNMSMYEDLPGCDGEMPPTGFTPGRQFGGSGGMPQTPKDASVGGASDGDFAWDNFGAGSGLTPMSEGVLRTMLQLGPMETMDLGWENSTLR